MKKLEVNLCTKEGLGYIDWDKIEFELFDETYNNALIKLKEIERVGNIVLLGIFEALNRKNNTIK